MHRHQRLPDGNGYPSTALRVTHTILVATAVLFAFGFAVYLFVVARPRAAEQGSTVAADAGVVFACGAGVALAFYLRSFVRRTAARRRLD